MHKRLLKLLSYITILLVFLLGPVYSEVVKKINVNGNERVSKDTIIMFSSIKINDEINQKILNNSLKLLYETNFFENVSYSFENNILKINVIENPIINTISFEGIKSNTIKEKISKKLKLKSRSSFNINLLNKDKEHIQAELKNLGYFFSKIDISTIDLGDKKLDLIYKIELGNKAKIKKINFLGDKIFKDKRLRNIIISEEYKFWKFISGKKYLNESIIQLDKRLLKNFYLNNGYYDAEIKLSFAQLVSDDEFELTFNIQPKNKFYFNELKIDIPADFDPNNYIELKQLFEDLKGAPYSLNTVEKIIDKIDLISVNDQFESVKASVNEEIINDQINLNFLIEKTEIYFVDRINIFGNNVTRENVIRNQLEIDEGDPFNDILHTRSINNIRSLNFFRNVNSEVIQSENSKDKIINISVEEKPTGEITAGAGFGTSGSTLMFGVKENNYLGKGIGLDANMTVSEESLKGLIGVTNPNYKNSDKSVYLNIQATEEDQLTNFGYKSNKAGFSFGTDFEYLRNLNFGIGTSSFYENIDTNSSASARQKKQKGNYWDTFLNLRFDYDVRNQKFRTTDGFRNIYAINIPLLSETNTLTNSINYKVFKELFEDNVTSASLIIKSANSLSNNDIKLSERLFVPSRRLRGFENGKIGPKDGADYIGGNYMATLNFSTTLPQILPNAQNTDFLFFFDAGNVWGVDYDSSLEEDLKIRSAVGIGVDFYTAIGPLNFSLSQPISKADTDKTETFRFNIGTSF